jgi:hypothetical protein
MLYYLIATNAASCWFRNVGKHGCIHINTIGAHNFNTCCQAWGFEKVDGGLFYLKQVQQARARYSTYRL